MPIYQENEISQPVLLCSPDGTLNRESAGWARKPLFTSNLSGNFLRKKKWNYWCIFGEKALFSATISHLDYASVCFVYYLEYETKKFHEKTVLVPFDRKTKMPEQVQESVEFIHKDFGIFFIWNEDHVSLKISAADFGGEELKADIKVHYPEGMEGLNVVVPWNDTKFQFTAKHHCLPAEGGFTIGSQRFSFSKDTAFGVLDYGRGVWPYKSTWNWGMASGKTGDNIVGLNFGGKWTDGTGSNENAVIVNSALTKISEDVTFIYSADDYMKPWKIKSASERVSLTFIPFFERTASSNVGIVKSNVHQLAGHYSGKITLENGEILEVDGLLGCIEEHFAKW